jgi:uncharacterized membrane protein
MPPRSAAALLVLLLTVSAVGHSAGAAADPAASTAGSADAAPALAAGDRPALSNGTVPNTTLVLHVQPNGDAKWSVSTSFDIETESDREAFEERATDFQNGETPQLGLAAFRTARARASNATGRPMSINSVTRSRQLSNGTGTLVLEFTWTNFSRTVGSRIYVGDAFNTSDGGWLSGLRERQTLIIESPAGYSLQTLGQSVPDRVVNGTLRWHGPTEFQRAGPWVVYEEADDGNPTVTTTTSPATTTAGPSEEPGGVPAWSVLVVGVGLAAIGAYMLYGRDDDDRAGAGGAVVADDGDEGAAGGDAVADASPDTEANVATADADVDIADAAATEATSDVAPGTVAEGTEQATEGTDDEDVDETLLSDEERVERLLDANGGRMKQATIVDETGWSNAKVSQLLSSMAEEGRIEKLRLGRENLISFPEEDIGEFDT